MTLTASDQSKPVGAEPAAPPSAAIPKNPVERLLHGSILPTLLRLALPNVITIGAATFISVAETLYIGMLGTSPLAAMALAFPFVLLTQNFSSGAMGGGIASAISRALGARNQGRVEALALHAVVIGAIGGVIFTFTFIAFGPMIYRAVGGRGAVLADAVDYSNTLFYGVIILWLNNSMIAIVRGTGNMLFPAILALLLSTLQILLGGGLSLGIGPLPKLGIEGVALAQILATGASLIVVLLYLTGGRGRVTLRFRDFEFRSALFSDIAKPGALACLQPLQTVLIAVTLTSLVARFGTEALAGFSIALRLELALIPVAFGVGAAAVPMVGVAIGAGQLARAKQVAWTAGAVSFVILETIGLGVAFAPDVWAARFTDQAGVLEASRQYLRLAGPAFGFLGLGLTLFFAQQGSGKVLRPILASTFRLVLIIAIGNWLVSAGFPVTSLFVLSGIATAIYGLTTAGALFFTRWRPPNPTAALKGAR
jgi:putative MATE family efflux protein